MTIISVFLDRLFPIPYFSSTLFLLHFHSQFDVRAIIAATQKGPNGCTGTFCQPNPAATKQQQQKLLLGVNDISTATALNIRASWFSATADGMPGGNKKVGLFFDILYHPHHLTSYQHPTLTISNPLYPGRFIPWMDERPRETGALRVFRLIQRAVLVRAQHPQRTSNV